MNVLSEIPQWPLASRLDEVPTRTEIQKAINQMSNGKAPGTDGIPAEVFKKCISCLLPQPCLFLALFLALSLSPYDV